MLSHGVNSGKRKHKPSYRPKIRWEFFGLPNSEAMKPSIEVIRREVSTLAVARLARRPKSQSKAESGIEAVSAKASLDKHLQEEVLDVPLFKELTMAKNQKQTPKTKTTGPQASRSSADKNFTCSEVQLDDLLSEGESTGP